MESTHAMKNTNPFHSSNYYKPKFANSAMVYYQPSRKSSDHLVESIKNHQNIGLTNIRKCIISLPHHLEKPNLGNSNTNRLANLTKAMEQRTGGRLSKYNQPIFDHKIYVLI